jgi:hypothetical protein
MRARMKTSVVWPTIMTSAVALLAGCEGVSDDAGGGEGGGSGSQPGKVIPQGQTDKASDFFEISADASGDFPADVATHFCNLSFLRGPFQGSIDLTFIDRVNEWDSWQLHRYIGFDDWKDASAVCTNWNNFRMASGGFHMVSTGVQAKSATIGIGEDTTNEWQGDAMLFLRGIAGVYESDDEFAKTIQSTTVAGVNKLYVHDSTTSAVSTKGFSHAVFAGVPQVQLVKTINYNSSNATWVRGNVNSGGDVREFPISTTSGFSSHWLSPVHDGFCGYTRLSGRFDGGEERVRLYVNGGNWYMKAWAHEGKTVVARARCMAYDQR